ncbi:unnamed protein product [Cylicocyclus nassatus]|uniref:SH3 domain-containing protein n=1 Tax=Cylicocyclus nassatus TaxID=53992 RepID=A0AA36GSJ9_CYLNA|nr:unnamed protein product [Cylicocyclus nassatus]
MIFLTLLKKGETDPKVAKAFSKLQQTEALSKEINNELLESLPLHTIIETFCVNTLQLLFNTHDIYQSECNKLNIEIVSQLDSLGESINTSRVPRPEPRPETPTDSVADVRLSKISSHRSTPSPVPAPPPATPASLADSAANQPNASFDGNPFEEDNVEEVFENKIYPKLAAVPPGADKEEEKNANETPKKVEDPTNSFEGNTDEEQHEQVPIEAPPTDHALAGVTREAGKVLYLVRTTHEYKAVDTDELSFGPGDDLKVLESKHEDQVDEGWQLSEKADGTRGVFPENFTRRFD